ncbi:MAG: 4-hydroxybenzoate octaprenyltransferase [Magnetospiraceae bacterium]
MSGILDTSPSDIPQGSWIDRWAPAYTRPFLRLMRLDRPIGTWLLLFPCWWSLALANPGWPDGRWLWYAALFGVGALVMRGAGCTVNDIADREFDGKVARTANRPLPSGAVSLKEALIFLVLQLLVGLLILVQFNLFAILLGAASLGLVAIYPFAKRVTYWPQVVLGLTFNWGALLGWAAIQGSVGLPALALYVAGLFWTLGYDTVYAHQDKEDDLFVGVKSTALRLGSYTRPFLYGFYGLALTLIGLACWTAGLPWFTVFGLALAGAHLYRQANGVDLDDPKDCLRMFKSNRDFGWILLLTLLAGQAAR